MAKHPVLVQLADNKRKRVKALKDYDKLRDQLVAIVKKAHEGGELTMIEIAAAADMDRRTVYDLLKNDRHRRLGAGAERTRA